MKVFLGLLLIVNVAFAIFQWLVPHDQLFDDSKKAPVSVALKLLGEKETVIVKNPTKAPGKLKQPAIKEVLVVENTRNSKLCFTIGPFKDKAKALVVNARYSSKGIKTELKSNPGKEYLGVMVFIGGHKNRAAAVKTAASLASRGVRDYLILNEPGKVNVLSLGVFELKKNADSLLSRIRRMKYKVESEARYRSRIIYWLYNEQSSEKKLQNLLNKADAESGISQITSQCS